MTIRRKKVVVKLTEQDGMESGRQLRTSSVILLLFFLLHSPHNKLSYILSPVFWGETRDWRKSPVLTNRSRNSAKFSRLRFLLTKTNKRRRFSGSPISLKRTQP